MRRMVVKENSGAALRALRTVEAETSEAPYDADLEYRLATALIAV